MDSQTDRQSHNQTDNRIISQIDRETDSPSIAQSKVTEVRGVMTVSISVCLDNTLIPSQGHTPFSYSVFFQSFSFLPSSSLNPHLVLSSFSLFCVLYPTDLLSDIILFPLTSLQVNSQVVVTVLIFFPAISSQMVYEQHANFKKVSNFVCYHHTSFECHFMPHHFSTD